MNTRLISLAFTGLAALTLSGAALAQEPGHPRVNEVDQRLENQQNRIENGIGSGQMTPRQAAHDERHDQRVENQLSRDEAKHGGHITKREQHRLNRELNHNSHAIHHQRHHHKAQPEMK